MMPVMVDERYVSACLPHPPAHQARHRPLAGKIRTTRQDRGMFSRVPAQLPDKGHAGINAEESGCHEAVDAKWRH